LNGDFGISEIIQEFLEIFQCRKSEENREEMDKNFELDLT